MFKNFAVLTKFILAGSVTRLQHTRSVVMMSFCKP